MKTIRNSKEASCIDGITIYRMERIVDGREWSYQVAVTAAELEQGRGYVAYKLRYARRALQSALAWGAKPLPQLKP